MDRPVLCRTREKLARGLFVRQMAGHLTQVAGRSLDDLVSPETALLPRSGPVRRDGLRIAALSSGVGDKAASLPYEPMFKTPPSEAWMDRCKLKDHRHTGDAREGARPAQRAPLARFNAESPQHRVCVRTPLHPRSPPDPFRSGPRPRARRPRGALRKSRGFPGRISADHERPVIARANRDGARGDWRLSSSILSRARSFRLARRMAAAISGQAILEKPRGSPRLRSDSGPSERRSEGWLT